MILILNSSYTCICNFICCVVVAADHIVIILLSKRLRCQLFLICHLTTAEMGEIQSPTQNICIAI